MPLKRSEVIEAFYDAHLKLFKCPFPDYQVTSKRKSNLKRHIKSCETQKKKKRKKKRKVGKNTCPYYKTTFSQKYNQGRHVRNDQDYVDHDKEVIEALEEAMERTSQESAIFQMLSCQLRRY